MLRDDTDEKDSQGNVIWPPKKWWPHGTSPERINFLAGVRNEALAPLQSSDPETRLPDYAQFTKILFLNDIYFTWQSLVNLLETRLSSLASKDDKSAFPRPTDYDMACATDFGNAGKLRFRLSHCRAADPATTAVPPLIRLPTGLYDTWVGRDICGLPMRTSWPYVKTARSIDAVRAEQPFEVASCWNGAVAMAAKPYLYQPATHALAHASKLRRRGWRMMDNESYPNAIMTPAPELPVQFRGPHIPGICDASECFLFSYDLHLLYNTTPSSQGRVTSSAPSAVRGPSIIPALAFQETILSWQAPYTTADSVLWEAAAAQQHYDSTDSQSRRRPRIYMNPTVQVAYEAKWFRWHTQILHIPIIRWWLGEFPRPPESPCACVHARSNRPTRTLLGLAQSPGPGALRSRW